MDDLVLIDKLVEKIATAEEKIKVLQQFKL